MPDTQTCTRCKRTKPIDEFEGRKRCRTCRAIIARSTKKPENVARKNAYDKARYEEDPKAKMRSNERWRNANPEEFLPEHRIRASRRRARKRAATVEIFLHSDLIAFWEERGICPNRCFYCGGGYEHNDHVVPIARGGTHERANLLPACGPCNDSKGAKPLSQWRGGIHEQEALWALGLMKEIAQSNPIRATQQGPLETGDTQFPFEKVS